jgi:hypothetical protein
MRMHSPIFRTVHRQHHRPPAQGQRQLTPTSPTAHPRPARPAPHSASCGETRRTRLGRSPASSPSWPPTAAPTFTPAITTASPRSVKTPSSSPAVLRGAADQPHPGAPAPRPRPTLRPGARPPPLPRRGPADLAGTAHTEPQSGHGVWPKARRPPAGPTPSSVSAGVAQRVTSHQVRRQVVNRRWTAWVRPRAARGRSTRSLGSVVGTGHNVAPATGSPPGAPPSSAQGRTPTRRHAERRPRHPDERAA